MARLCTKDARLGGGAWTTEAAFIFLFLINLLNYVDRGIIPGANKEFLSFISASVHTEQPDLFLGLLQSAFIVGFSIAALIFGHLIHHYPPFRLAGIGLTVWVVATLFSGLSRHTGSYTFLFIARMLSGVGEASFQCVAPPFITDLGGSAAGRWLSLFYTAIPVGTAAGYPWGAAFAKSSWGWQWAFFFESAAMAPLAVTCFFVPFTWRPERPAELEDDGLLDSIAEREQLTRGGSASIEGGSTALRELVAPDSDGYERDKKGARHITVAQELRAILARPVFVLIVLGYAAQTGMMIGVSTFGSALLLEFGYYKDETTASTVFGALLSVAGMLGTPLGGLLVDRKTFRSEEAKLAFLTRQNLVFSALGMVASCLSCLLRPKEAFLFFLAVGAFMLFAATAGINYAVMLSVPPANRSFAIGLNTLGIHALGDVPSPIIVGAILDRLAPACAAALKASGNDASDFVTTPECQEQLPRVRLTLFIATLWLTVTVVTFLLAWLTAVRGERKHHAKRSQLHRAASLREQVKPLLQLQDDDFR